MAHDFPFTMRDMIRLLDLDIRYGSLEGSRVYVDCVFPECNREHHHKKGKMKIDFRSDTYVCFRCGAHGGMLDLYGSVRKMNRRAARREIIQRLGIDEKEYRPKKQPPKKKKEPEYIVHKYEQPEGIADIEVRHKTYTKLLSLLQLSDSNRQNLKDRGLTDGQIAEAGFKSTPAYGFAKLTQTLIDSGCSVEGVPGFYQMENGSWTAKFSSFCSGLLIPYRDLQGRIQALQIRLDRPYKDAKYIWWSSIDKKGGVGSGSPAHFIGDLNSKTVNITEGALKACVAHYLSGETFVAVAGTGSIGYLSEFLPLLCEYGGGEKTFCEAYDMDKYRNENVLKDLFKLYVLVAQVLQYPFERRDWQAEKGIDDLYLGKRRQMTIKRERKLVEQLHHLSASVITEAEYDKLRNELCLLEKETGIIFAGSPTWKFGYPVASNLQAAQLKTPLLSYHSTKRYQNVIELCGDRDVLLRINPCGLATKLTYENGKLTQVSTSEEEEESINAVGLRVPVQIPYKQRLVVMGKTFAYSGDGLETCAQRTGQFLPCCISGLPNNSKAQQLSDLYKMGFGLCYYFMLGKASMSEAALKERVEKLRQIASENHIPIDGVVFAFDDGNVDENNGVVLKI